MIVFQNKGLIDTKFITTFGVSAKEGENPVGFFGTGLKYAIAVCMREKQNIVIDIGGATHWFSTEQEQLRNKDFEFIFMHWEGDHGEEKLQLPFTTELGKKWKLWQAFRELYCNCTDEDGEIYEHRGSPVYAQEDETVIRVTGEEFDQCWRDKSHYILDKEPIYRHFMADVCDGMSKALYMRSIRVQELNKPSLFTYNVLFQAELTEDRTLKYDFEGRGAVSAAWMASKDKESLRRVLLAEQGTYEQELDFSGATEEFFLDLVGELRVRHFGRLNKSALRAYEKQRRKAISEDDAVELTELEKKMLERAKTFVKEGLQCDYLDDYQIVVIDLDENTLGLAHQSKIFLSRRCFRMGTKMVASTMYEEYLHLHRGLADCNREMQNFLMDTITSLAEERMGEPL